MDGYRGGYIVRKIIENYEKRKMIGTIPLKDAAA